MIVIRKSIIIFKKTLFRSIHGTYPIYFMKVLDEFFRMIYRKLGISLRFKEIIVSKLRLY